MNKNNLNKKIINATKWSGITEVLAKLIVPITNMVLARILMPEDFGVVATITMIVSFADMLTDSGFQKYLVQHEFESEKEKIEYTNVAFWTNFGISMLLWIIISVWANRIANIIGNNGLESVIRVACIQLPLTSFSSIQMSIYRRDFDFKTLFFSRIVGICIPFIVTIPLALSGYKYWALIIGNIVGALLNSLILTIKSKWKPSLYYDLKILKKMWSFSIWTLAESISIWMTTWIDTFIISSMLSEYYLGIYKNSLSMVNSIFLIITASTTPILFSALSRVQNESEEFNRIFCSMHKSISYLILPMSFGMYMYSDFMVEVLFGKGWSDAIPVIGPWALSSGIVILFGNYFSEVYRAKGMPKLSFLVQILHLIVLIPVCITFSNYGFFTLVNIRAAIRLELVLVHIIVMKFIIKIPMKYVFKNISIPLICSVIMSIIAFYIKDIYQDILWNVCSIIICIISYVVLLMCFKESRKDILKMISKSKLVNKLKYKNARSIKIG